MTSLMKQIKLLEKTIAQKTEAEQANFRLMADLTVMRENKSREAPRPPLPQSLAVAVAWLGRGRGRWWECGWVGLCPDLPVRSDAGAGAPRAVAGAAA